MFLELIRKAWTGRLLCSACMSSSAKHTPPRPGPPWSEPDGRSAWVTSSTDGVPVMMVIDVWVRATVFTCLFKCGCFSVLCLVLFLPYVSPLRPPPSRCEGLGDSMPVVWNSACAFAALRSAGLSQLQVSLPPALSPSLPFFPVPPFPVPLSFPLSPPPSLLLSNLTVLLLSTSWHIRCWRSHEFWSPKRVFKYFNSVCNCGKTQTWNPSEIIFHFPFSFWMFIP